MSYQALRRIELFPDGTVLDFAVSAEAFSAKIKADGAALSIGVYLQHSGSPALGTPTLYASNAKDPPVLESASALGVWDPLPTIDADEPTLPTLDGTRTRLHQSWNTGYLWYCLGFALTAGQSTIVQAVAVVKAISR